MLSIEYKKDFLKTISKIKDASFKERIKKQIETTKFHKKISVCSRIKILDKIIENPEIGKPMRYNRKNTRELYLSPYRIAYAYIPFDNKLIFLDIYHKDEQ